MDASFLFCLYFLVSLLSVYICKRCTIAFGNGHSAAYAVNALLNGLFAMLFFFLFGGFRVEMNGLTWLYAGAFALVCLISELLTLVIYKYIGILSKSIFSLLVSVAVLPILCLIVYDEEIGTSGFLRMGLMLIAVLFLLIDGLKKDRSNEPTAATQAARTAEAAPKDKRIGYILLFLLCADSVCSTLISRSFAKSAGSVTDENSFFFSTNLILAGITSIWLLAIFLRQGAEAFKPLFAIPIRRFGLIPIRTATSNALSLINIWLLQTTVVAIISPLCAALGLVAAAVCSLFFREKITALSGFSILFAGLAVLLPLLF